MKTHTSEFKNTIKTLGRQYAVRVTYNNTTLDNEDILNVTLNYKGDILKSVMKQLELESNIDIPIETQISLEIGLLVGSEYEYLNYGTFIVNQSEKQENTGSFVLTCYDKMLLSMVSYENLEITYPITIRDYINAISTKLGLAFANSTEEFVNYDKQIKNELYLDSQNNDLGYTFRDVLDELAQVTASTICINDNDELEIRYIQDTKGDNLYNYKDVLVSNDEWSQGDDGWLTLFCDNSTGTSTKWANYFTRPMDLETNKNYSIVIEIAEVENLGGLTLNQLRATEQFVAISSPSLRVGTSVRIAKTKDSFENVTMGLRMLASVGAGQIAKAKLRISVLDEENVDVNNFKYRTFFGDTINEEYLKNVNVNFGEQYGAVNTIVLSRSAGADKISQSIPSDLSDDDKVAIEISDNQIMNWEDRSEYLTNILNTLYGLQYYTNDFKSTGILYYDLCDRYNVQVGEEFYSCVMLNDEININNGLEENIYTEMPIQATTDYTKTSKTDRNVRKATIEVDKQKGTIEALASRVSENEENISQLQITDTAILTNVSSLTSSTDNNTNAINNLSNQVSTLQTSTSLQINAISQTLENGVEKLSNSLVTIDTNGINTSRADETFNTQITNKTFEVKDGDRELAFMGYDSTLNKTISRIDELESRKATIGVHRCETITRNGKKRTAWFFVGGGN